MKTYNYKTYENAEKKAEELGLKLAEYGDFYNEDKAYAYWNKTGNRHDKAIVYCEYKIEQSFYRTNKF